MGRVIFKYTVNYRVLDGESSWITEEFTSLKYMQDFVGEVIMDSEFAVDFEIDKEKIS